MTHALNIPIPASAYQRPRPVLRNRKARRGRNFAAPELTLIKGHANGAPALPALPPMPEPVAQGTAGHRASSELAPVTTSALSQAVLLDWLGSQAVAYHRVYVDVCGSVTAAVWLSMALSLLDGEGKRQVDAKGIFRFTLHSKVCEEHTGLTDAEQRRARQHLIDAQLMVKETTGRGERAMLAMDMNRLTERLLAHSEGLAQLLRQSALMHEPKASTDTLERRAKARALRSA